jgi:hypothetical protein
MAAIVEYDFEPFLKTMLPPLDARLLYRNMHCEIVIKRTLDCDLPVLFIYFDELNNVSSGIVRVK